MSKKAEYRKINDRSRCSSTYHKKDGTNVRGILKNRANRTLTGDDVDLNVALKIHR